MKMISKSVILSLLGLLLSANLAQGMEDPNLPPTPDPESSTQRAKIFAKSDFGKLPKELIATIFSFFIPKEALQFKLLSSDSRLKSSLQHASHWSSLGVGLRDNTWMFFPDAVHQGRSSEIVRVNNVDYLITHLPFWREETIVAAQHGAEPEYLKAISALYKVKIDAFIFAKEAALRNSGASKAQWQRHAYSVLFAWKAAIHAAGNAAGNAASLAARNDARNDAFYAVDGAAMHAARNDARNDAFEDALDALDDARHTASLTAMHAAMAELRRLELNQPEERGRLAYRIAEKVALVSYLQDAQNVFDASYSASLNALPQNSEGIFTSKASWNAYKERYFATVLANPEQAHFIQAWTDNLDRIAGIIETLD